MGAVDFVDASVSEVVVEMGLGRAVFLWEFGDGGSCRRSCMSAGCHQEKNDDVAEIFGYLPLFHRPISFAPQ